MGADGVSDGPRMVPRSQHVVGPEFEFLEARQNVGFLL